MSGLLESGEGRGAATLEVRHVSKRFGGTRALDDVSLTLRRGEIVGLVGENGSGKSTLVKVLTGIHAPDPGAIGSTMGKPVDFPIASAADLGIAVIHQDLGLAGEMSVLENLGAVANYGARSSFGHVRWREERERCRELLSRFGLRVELDALIREIDPAERAMIAMVRATRQLANKSRGRIFILDEPTAFLADAESKRVIDTMRAAAAEGASVVFISHHLNEVLDVCDRIEVLRSGRNVASIRPANATPRDVISHMLGRDLAEFYPERSAADPSKPVVLRAEGLRGAVVDGVSFELRKGEILGVTGLVGMGQQELPYLIAGVTSHSEGVVSFGDGQPVANDVPGVLAQGIALIPADRQKDGLWPDALCRENISLPILKDYFRGGLLRLKEEASNAKIQMDRFGVVPSDPEMAARSFSGGNQQKMVLAKWMQRQPRILLLDEPTQGVDAGARREILELVREAAMGGVGVMLFSSDLEQLANVATRALVFSQGRIVRELSSNELTSDALLLAANE